MAFNLSPVSLASMLLVSNVVPPLQIPPHQPVAIVSEAPPRSGNLAGIKSSMKSWNLPNGEVRFSNPLTFSTVSFKDGSISTATDQKSSVLLWNPTFLGSGGSGAVFSFDTNSAPPKKTTLSKSSPSPTPNLLENNGKIAIKVSWVRSRLSVENECSILQTLEDRQVPHLERCVGRPNAYPDDDQRVMIALTPVMVADGEQREDAVTASLSRVNSGDAQRRAVRSVVETMVRMLAAGVTTADVQPLIYKETGEVLFIDLTEAQILPQSIINNKLSSLDVASVLGFCSEMFALVPDNLRDLATLTLKKEIDIVGNSLSGDYVEVLESVWTN